MGRIQNCIVLCVLLASGAQGAPSVNSAGDIAIIDAHILTGRGLLERKPEFVSAMAFSNGIVTNIGDSKTVITAVRKGTKIIDLHGRFVMPGFNDAHVHLADGGLEKLRIELSGTNSLEEMQERIRVGAERAAPRAWLLGGGWDHTKWASKRLPSRLDLDAVTEGHPAYFVRVDEHIAVLNTAGLAALGINDTVSDPHGGKFDRDATGALTGIVREAAKEEIADRLPAPTLTERRNAVELALMDAAAHGVTSVQDNSPWPDFKIFEDLEQSGLLPLRISEWLPFNEPLNSLRQMREEHSLDDPMLHTGMLKGFLDGSLGSRTAALKLPYADEPANSGILQYEQILLDKMTVERARAGFQIGFHAIGDRAVTMALDAFETAERAVPKAKEYRLRIEHSQVVSPGDFRRYFEFGIVASMQPSHLLTDMRWAIDRLGNGRARYSYAWKSMLDHKVMLAFGTDYPVESISPFRGLYAAVTRMAEPDVGSDALEPYFPEERLTIYQALYAYTQGAAYAEHMETKKGKLLPGFLADFVVLDRDLTNVAPALILRTKVIRTVVGGKTVFEQRRIGASSR